MGVINKNKNVKMNQKLLSVLPLHLFALFSILPLFGEEESEGWMPQWKIGDWWIVKQSTNANYPPGSYPPHDSIPNLVETGSFRFEVLGHEEVNGQLCFAVERKQLPHPRGKGGIRYIYYFQKDNLRLLRYDAYRYSTREFSFEFSKLFRSFDYHFDEQDKDRPVFQDIMSIPAFPLVTHGLRAMRLSEPHLSPVNISMGPVSQKVSEKRIREFSQELDADGIEHPMDGLCYYVLLEASDNEYAKQLWDPQLVWPLFNEFGFVVTARGTLHRRYGFAVGERIPFRREWLIDWSSRYKIIEDQKK